MSKSPAAVTARETTSLRSSIRLPFSSNSGERMGVSGGERKTRGGELTHRARVVDVEDDVEEGQAHKVESDLLGHSVLGGDGANRAVTSDVLGERLEGSGRVEGLDVLWEGRDAVSD